MGLEQAENGKPSRLHSNPATATLSVPVNVNLVVAIIQFTGNVKSNKIKDLNKFPP